MKKRIKIIQVEGCSCCERNKSLLKREQKKHRATINLYEKILEQRPFKDS